MDYRIEIKGVLYPSVSHLTIHEEAKQLCAQLGTREYYIVSILVEGVSNPYYTQIPDVQDSEELFTRRQYLERL